MLSRITKLLHPRFDHTGGVNKAFVHTVRARHAFGGGIWRGHSRRSVECGTDKSVHRPLTMMYDHVSLFISGLSIEFAGRIMTYN